MQTGIHSFLSETYSSTIWVIPVICPGIYRITQTKDIFMLLVTGTMPYIQKEVIQICLMSVRLILLSYFSPSVFLLLPPKNFPNLYHSLSSRCHCVSIVCHYLLPGIFYDFLSGFPASSSNLAGLSTYYFKGDFSKMYIWSCHAQARLKMFQWLSTAWGISSKAIRLSL